MFPYDFVLICGSGHIAAQIARHLSDFPFSVGVLELKISGASTLKAYCTQINLPYQSVHKGQMYDEIMSLSEKNLLIISAANNYLFPPVITNKENITIVNYHNALLPAHRGLHAEAWQIFDQDALAGITWHFIDDRIDTGAIIAQESFALTGTETALSLLRKQNKIAFDTFLHFVNHLFQKEIDASPQPFGKVLHLGSDRPGGGYLNPEWDFAKMSAFLRSFDYGPLMTLGKPKITIDGKHYEIGKYTFIQNESPKTKIDHTGSKIVIAKGADSIVLSLVS
ncbi:MAG: hypothetical protein LBM60_05635 [Clostridium sp.]|nr:hypothetical protein [Clostridium sp.]